VKRKFNRTKARRYWLGVAAIALAALLVLANAPVGAAPMSAPVHQTVPLPTATSEPAPLPTATPSNDDDDDEDDEEDSSPEPEPTPEPAPDDEAGDSVDELIDESTDIVEGDVVGEVVVTQLNVRQGPSADTPLIGTLAAGDQVALLGRNEAGDWWVVCCVDAAGQPGWASAQFIRPNIRRVDVNGALPVAENLDELLAANADASIPDEDIVASEESEQALLRLRVELTSPYVRQGDEVVLRFTVINDGNVEAQNVTLTDELPAEFSFGSLSVENDGASQQRTGSNGAVIVQIDWPAIAPGEEAAADLTMILGSDVSNGIVIDNLAVATADNAVDVSGGISMGTAPSLLPDF
jgi:uncharacterized repeat protein (TIGR01451 family)